LLAKGFQLFKFIDLRCPIPCTIGESVDQSV
jgi:hypothetical protein